MSEPAVPLLISVVIVNYNGKAWLRNCLETLRAQTLDEQTEIIFVDNLSHDGSDALAQELMKGWPRGTFIQTGANLGYGGGGNRGAAVARGKYLFFLNPDVLLERNCLERLTETAEHGRYDAVGPKILDYDNDSIYFLGVSGFDIFGLPVEFHESARKRHLFSFGGCSYFIRRDLFEKIGGWDEVFFMYGEEMDIAWRIWIAGGTVGMAHTAQVRHRDSAVSDSTKGDQAIVLSTSDFKRFCAYRNHLLTLLKAPQHILLLLLVPAVALTLLEGLVGVIWLRRWSFFSNTSWRALVSCWQMRKHWMEERRRIKRFRQRGDFWMIRFLSGRLSRWYQIKQVWEHGMPKVEQH